MNYEGNSLWEQMVQFQHLMRKGHACRHRDSPTGDSTRGQGRTLSFLKLKDGIRTRDLAYLLDMRISSLNELLAKLEKGGYLTREPDPEDKRVMLVYLTEKGRTEEQSCPRNDLFACLTEEEQTVFGTCLGKLIAALEAELGKDAPDFEALHYRRQMFFRDSNSHGECGHGCQGEHGKQGGQGCHGEHGKHGTHNAPGCHNGHGGCDIHREHRRSRNM